MNWRLPSTYGSFDIEDGFFRVLTSWYSDSTEIFSIFFRKITNHLKRLFILLFFCENCLSSSPLTFILYSLRERRERHEYNLFSSFFHDNKNKTFESEEQVADSLAEMNKHSFMERSRENREREKKNNNNKTVEDVNAFIDVSIWVEVLIYWSLLVISNNANNTVFSLSLLT